MKIERKKEVKPVTYVRDMQIGDVFDVPAVSSFGGPFLMGFGRFILSLSDPGSTWSNDADISRYEAIKLNVKLVVEGEAE